MTSEDRETRIKRLRIRSWRRGIKEMDLILGDFADLKLAQLNDDELDEHETLMAENDHDLYLWISEQAEPPALLISPLQRVKEHFLKSSK